MAPIDAVGGTFNKILNQNWKLNIDLRQESDGGTARIYQVNSLMLNHRGISRWYGITSLPEATQETYGTTKIMPSDYLRIGSKEKNTLQF